MQLNSVVLPAPFGPMSPTISPGSMASDTSRLASRPPKRLLAASTLSKAAMALRRRARRRPPPEAQPAGPRQREQAGRTERRDDDDDEAVDDQVDAAPGERPRAERRAHDLRDRDEDDGAEHRAPQPPDAADHRRHDRQRGPVELKHLLGKHRQRPEGVEHAGGGEDGGGDRARDHLVAPAVDADALGGFLIVADGAEVIAELGALDEGHERQR